MRHAQPSGVVVWLLAIAVWGAMFGLSLLLARWRKPRTSLAPPPARMAPQPHARDTQSYEDFGPVVSRSRPYHPEGTLP